MLPSAVLTDPVSYNPYNPVVHKLHLWSRSFLVCLKEGADLSTLVYFGRAPLDNRHPQLMPVPKLGGGYVVTASLSPGTPCTAAG